VVFWIFFVVFVCFFVFLGTEKRSVKFGLNFGGCLVTLICELGCVFGSWFSLFAWNLGRLCLL